MMVKTFNIYIITVRSYKILMWHRYEITKTFLHSICSFKPGLFKAISEASRIVRIHMFSGAANKIFHENLWLKFSFKCFAGSKSLEIFSCSSHRSSTLRLVSPMYVCSYMTHDGYGFLPFSLKSCLTFFVIHFILISYELFVNSWNFWWKKMLENTNIMKKCFQNLTNQDKFMALQRHINLPILTKWL